MSPTEQNVNLSTAAGRYAVVERGDTPAEWNRLVETSPGGGHLFQSYEWGELKHGLGWRPVRVALERNGDVAGIGQFLFYNTPAVPGGMLYCPKGPWLPWDDEEAVRAFFDEVVEVAKRYNVHTVKIEPEVSSEREDVKEHLRALGFEKFRWNINHRATMIVDLSPPEEEILANMKRGTRYNVRLADRKGVEVVEDNSPAAQEDFWRMHGATVKRKDFWSRPRGYYEALWQTIRDAGRAHFFFAEHEGDRISGTLVLTFGRKCIYMLAGSTEEKRNLKPNYLLQWEVMKWAKQRGMDHYDMWGVPTPDRLDDESHPLHGVYKFKEGFGGELVDFVGTLDLPVKSARARLWNRIEPWYFRLHQRVKGDVYY